MKQLHIGLLPRVIIAIALGIFVGNYLPAGVIRLFVTFNALFGEFLGFAIPLIILGLVAVAIADIGNKAGRLLLITVAVAYGSTLVAGFISYFTGAALFPTMIDKSVSLDAATETVGLLPYFKVAIPPVMDVMTALVLSFMLGLGMASLQSNVLKEACRDFSQIITMVIAKVIVPLLPLYIFGIFLGMAHNGQVYPVLTVFVRIILVIFGIHIFVLLLQYAIAGILVRRNPLKLLYRMMPAYFTALGTQSSAATIPVTLAQAIRNGVSEKIAGFVIPLCATIHLSGSTLKIVACALALMIMQDMPYDFSMFAGFICLLGITMVAAPGVPGGAIMAALGVLQSVLGFDEAAQALMIALYIAMDSFGTACNVTGDGAIALAIDSILKKED
ncbi:MAG: dicarboxylate/amino acid:cation symporter [Prevotellaceae bacterium]|jgi:Na+/H+-dicarboxylate symporter|nr:dicarboxylate/amino acid:cation symporter [Prevotellaceae bacterium]